MSLIVIVKYRNRDWTYKECSIYDDEVKTYISDGFCTLLQAQEYVGRNWTDNKDFVTESVVIADVVEKVL
jgi:hypothetical protein